MQMIDVAVREITKLISSLGYLSCEITEEIKCICIDNCLCIFLSGSSILECVCYDFLVFCYCYDMLTSIDSGLVCRSDTFKKR